MQTISNLIGRLLWAGFSKTDLPVKVKFKDSYYDIYANGIVESWGEDHYFILSVDEKSKQVEKKMENGKWGLVE